MASSFACYEYNRPFLPSTFVQVITFGRCECELKTTDLINPTGVS